MLLHIGVVLFIASRLSELRSCVVSVLCSVISATVSKLRPMKLPVFFWSGRVLWACSTPSTGRPRIALPRGLAHSSKQTKYCSTNTCLTHIDWKVNNHSYTHTIYIPKYEVNTLCLPKLHHLVYSHHLYMQSHFKLNPTGVHYIHLNHTIIAIIRIRIRIIITTPSTIINATTTTTTAASIIIRSTCGSISIFRNMRFEQNKMH